MAKIINLPTLCKLTEQEKNELVIQVLELREKMNNIVDLMCDQEQTTDLRQRLYNELCPSNRGWRMPLKWYARLTRGKNEIRAEGIASTSTEEIIGFRRKRGIHGS